MNACFCRSSFDSSVVLSKRKAQTEGEDTEEDVEEQKVNDESTWFKEVSTLLYVMIITNLFFQPFFLTNITN